MADLNGTTNSELIEGTAEADLITALAGDDTVLGNENDDEIEGGEGSDTLFGGTGSNSSTNSDEDQDSLDGGSGDDWLFGNQGNDTLDGGEGNDTLFGGKNNDLVIGGAGDDVIIGDLGDSVGSGSTLPLDIVLLQDLSGSFEDDLPIIRELVPEFISSIEAIAPGSQFGAASFIDKPLIFEELLSLGLIDADDEPVYVYQTEQTLTSDADAFQAAVDGFAITGEGNQGEPEASLEALFQVALRTDELGFRDDAQQVVVISTDAAFFEAGDGPDTPNDGDTVLEGDLPGLGEDYPSVEQVRDALTAANITPIFTVTSGNISTYEDLVDDLGVGAVVELSSDSSNLVEAVTEGIEQIAMADTLTGGAGNDSFFFYQLDGQADQITDFESGVDSIGVSGENFGGGLTPGLISEDQFVIGSEAEDESDRFIYNETTGRLFFDPDGTGSTPATAIAVFDESPDISAVDIQVI